MIVKSQPSVTVLTTVYNGMPYLEEAIKSILDQSYENFEYLIIDDASPDPAVLDCIRSFSDSRIKLVINEENLGVSGSYNKALSLIKSEYVIRMDQDDISFPERIENQIKFLEENLDISVACSWEKIIDSNGNDIKEARAEIINYGAFLAPILLTISPIWHPSLAFRRDALEDIGGFKKEYTRAEDFEVTARFALERHSAAIIPKFDLKQRQHSLSQSREFAKEQLEICYQVQEETISNFLSSDQSKKLGRFFRLEDPPPLSEFNKRYLTDIKDILYELFSQVEERQNLSFLEMKAFKKVIFKRIGFGLRFFDYYRYLPSFLVVPIFYLLSPLYLNRFYKFLSWLYNSFNISGLKIK
jgi:glycosyltransferase involved in cell wall biosynthesis